MEHDAPKTCENLAKIVPRPSKIEPWGLQNRAWRPPRRHFLRTLNLRRVKRSYIIRFGGQKSQLGSILEAQDPPKSMPKPEKIDVEKQYILSTILEGVDVVLEVFLVGFLEQKSMQKAI